MEVDERRVMAKKCYVLDATALIQGLNPTALKQDLFTVPEVVDEARTSELLAIRMEAAISSRSLKRRRPSREAIGSVRNAVRDLGEGSALSDADLALLALAMDLKMEGRDVSIISDDYAIQNVSTRIDIPFVTVSSTGIVHIFAWSLFCPACRRSYPPGRRSVCPICGTTLRRRAVRKGRPRTSGRD